MGSGGQRPANGDLPGVADLREGLRVRLVGLRAQADMNGKEGRLGSHDMASRRWMFCDRRTRIRVKAAGLEVIGDWPKASLSAAFHDKAREFNYPDGARNQFVFDRMYQLAAAEGPPGVAAYFHQLLASEGCSNTHGLMK